MAQVLSRRSATGSSPADPITGFKAGRLSRPNPGLPRKVQAGHRAEGTSPAYYDSLKRSRREGFLRRLWRWIKSLFGWKVPFRCV